MNILILVILYILLLVLSLFVDIFHSKYPMDWLMFLLILLNLLQIMDEFFYLLQFRQNHVLLLKVEVLDWLLDILFLMPEECFCHLLEPHPLLLVLEELLLLLLGLLYLLCLLVPRLLLRLLKLIQHLFSLFHHKHLFLIYITEGLLIPLVLILYIYFDKKIQELWAILQDKNIWKSEKYVMKQHYNFLQFLLILLKLLCRLIMPPVLSKVFFMN